MMQHVLVASSTDSRHAANGDSANGLGESFLQALSARDFGSLEKLYKLEARFRAVYPSGEEQGKTAREAVAWFRSWLGNSDQVQVLQSTAGPVFDRFALNYQLRLHDRDDGWQVVEQHAFCDVQDGQIADMWLVCSGLRPDLDYSKGGPSAGQQPVRPLNH